MPTFISHAVVAMAAAKAFAPEDIPVRFYYLSVICAVIPDADVIGFSFGISYGHFFGHRGFFHSLSFALLLGFFIVSIFFRSLRIFSKHWWFYLTFFFMVSASHGVLDAFTNGGLGIALLSPFDNTRYFFPHTPIKVSPIGIKAFFNQRGLMVMKSELLWVWLPSMGMIMISILASVFIRHRKSVRK